MQPLAAGIIKNFKILYHNQLLQHALRRIKLESKTSYVISSVNLLKSIGCLMDPWRKVKKEAIVNCFSKCCFNEAILELFIDHETGAELTGLQIIPYS